MREYPTNGRIENLKETGSLMTLGSAMTVLDVPFSSLSPTSALFYIKEGEKDSSNILKL